MRRITLAAVAFMFVGIFLQTSYACSCFYVIPNNSVKKDSKIIKENDRKYYSNDFNEAVFTGKVLKIERIQSEITENIKISQNKISVDVEKYWLGVTEPIMTVYTGIGGGDCGVSFYEGNNYFFRLPYKQKKLQTSICDYSSEYPKKSDVELVKYFTEILGEAKTFGNDKNK